MSGETLDLTAADPHIVRTSAEETDGEFARFESTMHPAVGADSELTHQRWGIDLTAEHVHPKQAERIEVLQGELQVVLDGTEQTLTAGEEMTLPADVPHRHWNATDEPIRIVWEVSPALRTEEWAESAYVIAQKGYCDEDGVPNLLQAAVLVAEYPDENAYLTVAPVGLQRALFSALAPLGRLRGYEASHSRAEVDF